MYKLHCTDKKWFLSSLVLLIHCHILWQVCVAIVSLREYCDAFPDNLKPVICIIKETKSVSSSTTARSTTIKNWGWGWTEAWAPHPHPPYLGPPYEGWHESSESEESTGCSCDLKCIPRIGSNETESLQCKQCGNNCDVTTSVDPKCNCAAVGSGLSGRRRRRRKSIDSDDDEDDEDDELREPGQGIGEWRQNMGSTSCTCAVTCAHAQREERSWEDHHDSHDTPFCIFNITGLQSSSDRRPVTCECCKSKAALNNNFPDFVCICQRS